MIEEKTAVPVWVGGNWGVWNAVDLTQCNIIMDSQQNYAALVNSEKECVCLYLTHTRLCMDMRRAQGYHQIELTTESSLFELTTFVTYTGLWHSKRVMCWVSSAPQIYRHIIRQVLQGIPGVHHVSDDIIVSGENVQQHDERLLEVMQRLQDRRLTVNSKKYQFWKFVTVMPHRQPTSTALLFGIWCLLCSLTCRAT